MVRRGRPDLGIRAERLRQRLEKWRKTRKVGAPIPAPLWDAATKLAQAHGVNPVAKALGLDDDSLKQRTGLATGRTGRKRADLPAFVEVGVVEGPSAQQSVIELQHRGGAKLTIRLGPSQGSWTWWN